MTTDFFGRGGLSDSIEQTQMGAPEEPTREDLAAPGEGRSTWGEDVDAAGNPVPQRFQDQDGDETPKPDPSSARSRSDSPPQPSTEDPRDREIAELRARMAYEEGYRQAAGQQHAQQFQAQQQQAVEEYLREPELGDIEEAMADPDRFREALRAYANWGARQAHAQYGPVLGVVQNIMAEHSSMRNVAFEAAWERAQRDLQNEGINDAADFREQAVQLVWSQPRPEAEKVSFLMDPAAVSEAVRFVRRNSGRPAPAQGGAGGVPETPSSGFSGGGGSRSSAGLRPAMAHVARELGIKFSKESIAEHNSQFGGR